MQIIDKARLIYDKIYPVECQIGKTKLRYMGHIIRRGLNGSCMVTKDISAAYVEGRGRIGANKVCTFRSALEDVLALFAIDKESWEARAENKGVWKESIEEGMDRALGNWKVRRILISEARILRAERVMVMEEEQEDVDIVTINLPQIVDGGISDVMAVIGGDDIQVEVALTIDEKVQEDNTFILLDAQGETEIDCAETIDEKQRKPGFARDSWTRWMSLSRKLVKKPG